MPADTVDLGQNLKENNIISAETQKTENLAKIINGDVPAKMTEVSGKTNTQNGHTAVSRLWGRREPVENDSSDADDNNKDLSECLSECRISENGKVEPENTSGVDDEVVGKFSGLSIKNEATLPDNSAEKCKNVTDNDACVEIYPDKIMTEKEVREKQEAEDERKKNAPPRERGPTGGISVNYNSSDSDYRKTAAKSYPGFTNPTYYGMSNEYKHLPRTMLPSMAQMSNGDYSFGKRRIDDEEMQPYKYRPDANQRYGDFNNLDEPHKQANTGGMICTRTVSQTGMSGGQVSVKSPDILTAGMPPFEVNGMSTSFDCDAILNSLNESEPMYPTNQGGGFVNNDNIAPMNILGVMNNMSGANMNSACMTGVDMNKVVHDTNILPAHVQAKGIDHHGINSSAVNMNGIPASTWIENRSQRHRNDSGMDSASEGYSSEMSPYSEDQYSPPPSNISQSSEDSGVSMYCVRSPCDSSTMDVASPKSGYEQMSSVTDVRNGSQASPRIPPSPAGISQHVSAPSPGDSFVPQNIPVSVTEYSSMSPASDQSYDVSDCSMQSMPSPVPKAASDKSKFIDGHMDEYNDVLDVITRDMLKSNFNKNKQDKRMPKQTKSNTPLTKTVNVKNTQLGTQIPLKAQPRQQAGVQMVPHGKGSIPVQNSFPPTNPDPGVKLPATFLPNTATTTSSTSIVFVPQPITTMSIPVTLAPQTVNTAPKGSMQSVGGQILLIPPTQQASTILLVAPPQAPQKKSNVTNYRPIQPKLPVQPGPSSPASKTSGTDLKVSSSNSSFSSKTSVSSSKSQQLPVQNATPSKPTSQSHPATIQKSPSQMLNIARRLVANMTTEDIQYLDKDHDSYLHVAVCRADRNLVQALLERLRRENLHMVMIDIQNNSRQTPLYLAVSANQPEMVELFIQHGADVNLLAERLLDDGKTREVKAAIHCVSSNGKEYLKTLQALLKSSYINLNIANSDGQTALHCAIREHKKPQRDNMGSIDSTEIIETLIKAGADPNAQDKKSGKTPLMYAMETRDIRLIESMKKVIEPGKFRSFLRAQSFDGNTCLKIAESIRTEFDPATWERLSAMIFNTSKGVMSPNF